MKIICVGRNYAGHAHELNNPVPRQPMFFMKPDTALLPKNHPFHIPPFTNDLHFELELVVKINRLGKSIDRRFAHRYYSEIGLGIDFTARDIQAQLKEKGHPWERAKAFDFSAPVGHRFIPLEDLPPVDQIPFQLHRNGILVQDGHSADMIFPIDRLIESASQFVTLKIGDLLFTGTPEGVGPVQSGDRLEGFLNGEKLIDFKVY